MIKTLEKTGRTEDIAIADALQELGLDRDDVSVEILERAKSGFLGFGAAPAKVLIKYEVPDEPKAPAKKETPKPAPASVPAPEFKQNKAKKEETSAVKADAAGTTQKKADEAKQPSSVEGYADIREFLTGLLSRMGIEAEMTIGKDDKGTITVNLSGENMGAIIGRRGETLDAIQHLTNYVINRGNDKRTHINIDAEEYRSKREESLIRLAEKMAQKALKYKRSMALEPMNSYERHVIHTALQNYEGVTTASTGEEPNRRVVVSPVKTANEKNTTSKPKTREWA
ncbi:MAG: RNA-binding cell elongation regulator Jag/EloR [Eubacteriales bacterium]|nr:RNA-binding cell elongation regulator Jag/EloR [Eubacteriales bacterium]